MDVAEYVGADDQKLRSLSRAALIQIVAIQRIIRKPSAPVRYMTAMRLVAASNGEITMDAMRERGPMRGEETYDGPLGQKIAAIASTGPDISERLTREGIRRDQFDEMLLRGRMPRPQSLARMISAFDGGISEEDFRRHAEWRRERTS